MKKATSTIAKHTKILRSRVLFSQLVTLMPFFRMYPPVAILHLYNARCIV